MSPNAAVISLLSRLEEPRSSWASLGDLSLLSSPSPGDYLAHVPPTPATRNPHSHLLSSPLSEPDQAQPSS